MKKIACAFALLLSTCSTYSMSYTPYDPYSPYCLAYDWNTYSTSYELNFMLNLQCLETVIEDLAARIAELEEQTEENNEQIERIRRVLCQIQQILENYCCNCEQANHQWLNS